MQKIFALLPEIARSGSTVLLQGESGTGKELVARALHDLSHRAKGPFVAVNCGALPDTLLESELFGHTAGAFTDARKDRLGRFALAEKGTLLLDEIGDISPALQVRLLRVLEERTYMPLGSSRSLKADVRIITATHKDLAKLVDDGTFRKDLYYRVNVVKLTLPRLAERKEDIPLLAEHFIERFNTLKEKKILGLSHEALAIFMHHDWPGNVRELENAIEHAFILCPSGLIQLQHLPEHLRPESQTGPALSGLTLEEIEKRVLWEALERHQWQRLATARELGIHKSTLRRKINHYGLNPPGKAKKRLTRQ
jgi:transcriptional regulator with PAS, ATPase and Fis domain